MPRRSLPKNATFCLLSALALWLAGASARAAPPEPPPEDRIYDGDLDAEDVVGRATARHALVGSAKGAGAWVSLSGFTQRSLQGQRELGGLIVVGLPLDRIAGAAPTVVRPAAALPQETGIQGLSPKLARAAVEAGWRAASLSADDARLDAIVSRARWSAALPETRLRAVRFEDQRLSTDASLDASRLRDSTGANVGLEARLTWRFDRLLYADDEPAFERMRLERHDARARIAGRVLEALFHWQRGWLELHSARAAPREAHEPPNLPSRDETEAVLRIAEAEATLDVLTGGWFTSARSRAHTRAAPPALRVAPTAL